MTYNKAHPQKFAEAVHGGIKAVGDGIDPSDVGAAVTLFTTLAEAADEFKNDTDAAVMHFAAKLLDLFGDERVNPTTP